MRPLLIEMLISISYWIKPATSKISNRFSVVIAHSLCMASYSKICGRLTVNWYLFWFTMHINTMCVHSLKWQAHLLIRSHTFSSTVLTCGGVCNLTTISAVLMGSIHPNLLDHSLTSFVWHSPITQSHNQQKIKWCKLFAFFPFLVLTELN